jgi:AraC-like DNA-binding protein
MDPIAFEKKGFIDFDYRVENPLVPLIHSHSFYEVYYFHEGRCNYLIGDKIYMLSPGDLILMYGMTLHGANADPEVPYIRSIIHFEPTFLNPFFGMTHGVNFLKPFQEYRNHRISLSGKHKEEFEQLLFNMHEQQQKRNRIGTNRLQLAFVDLLYFIYDQYTNPLINKYTGASDKERSVQKIISFIENNYANDMRLEQMGEQLYFSKSYLAKLFKEVTGITVFNFIYHRRINQARILFQKNPKLSVTEVCLETGFKHLAHFSRLFKKQSGLTPEAYKRQIRDTDLNPIMKI